jgi:hypothetical protein
MLSRVVLGLSLATASLVVFGCGSSSGGGTPDAGLVLGASCTLDSDCASSLCRPYRQATVHFCTKSCTVATQAADCPTPPTTGTCSANGDCNFN